MTKYVLNTKTNRAMPWSPSFAKMKGLEAISEELFLKMNGLAAKPKIVATPGEATAASDAKGDTKTAKSDTPLSNVKETAKEEIPLSAPKGETAEERITREALEQANKEEKSLEGADFGHLSKDNVTLADVVAVPDNQIHSFSSKVMKLTMLPSDEPSKVREKLLQIVAKVEKKRQANQ
jgi:hypothetical protein